MGEAPKRAKGRDRCSQHQKSSPVRGLRLCSEASLENQGKFAPLELEPFSEKGAETPYGWEGWGRGAPAAPPVAAQVRTSAPGPETTLIGPCAEGQARRSVMSGGSATTGGSTPLHSRQLSPPPAGWGVGEAAPPIATTSIQLLCSFNFFCLCSSPPFSRSDRPGFLSHGCRDSFAGSRGRCVGGKRRDGGTVCRISAAGSCCGCVGAASRGGGAKKGKPAKVLTPEEAAALGAATAALGAATSMCSSPKKAPRAENLRGATLCSSGASTRRESSRRL